jgi:hypothetical protein
VATAAKSSNPSTAAAAANALSLIVAPSVEGYRRD